MNTLKNSAPDISENSNFANFIKSGIFLAPLIFLFHRDTDATLRLEAEKCALGMTIALLAGYYVDKSTQYDASCGTCPQLRFTCPAVKT